MILHEIKIAVDNLIYTIYCMYLQISLCSRCLEIVDVRLVDVVWGSPAKKLAEDFHPRIVGLTGTPEQVKKARPQGACKVSILLYVQAIGQAFIVFAVLLIFSSTYKLEDANFVEGESCGPKPECLPYQSSCDFCFSASCKIVDFILCLFIELCTVVVMCFA